MKIKRITRLATRNLKAALAAKSAKGQAKTAKAEKRVYKGITGRAILLVTGAKGCAFRLAEIDKAGYGQLVQNNIGLKYDGAKVDLLDAEGKHRDKQTRLELGDYIASKGERVKIKVLSLAEAEKLAKSKHTVERNGKEVKIRTFGNVENHYVASIERFKTGIQHWFQWETESLGAKNRKHFAAMVQ